MTPAARTLEMTRRERLAARYVTGPAGHFVAGSIDLALAVGRILIARAGAALAQTAGRASSRRRRR